MDDEFYIPFYDEVTKFTKEQYDYLIRREQMPNDRVTLEEVFTYQEADENQIASMQKIRQLAFDLAVAITDECPACADRSTAIRKVRESVMTANAAIVLKGMV